MTRAANTASRRWLRWGLVVTTVATGAAGLAAGPAQAESLAGGGFMSRATSRCLDSDHAGSVYTNGCGNGNDYQRWVIEGTPLGYNTLRNVATGRCLDSNAEGRIYTNPCDGYNQYQNWDVSGDGPVLIRDLATNRCVDSNSAGQAYTSGCDWNNQYQQWI